MKRNEEIKGTVLFFSKIVSRKIEPSPLFNARKIEPSPLFQRNGFTHLEYAIMIAILVAALIGMALYFQRSLQGRYRDAGDSLGFGRQYNGG